MTKFVVAYQPLKSLEFFRGLLSRDITLNKSCAKIEQHEFKSADEYSDNNKINVNFKKQGCGSIVSACK